MWSVHFLVLILTLNLISGEQCLPGMNCWDQDNGALAQIQPSIHDLKDKIMTIYRLTGERVASARALTTKNIADSKNLTFTNLRMARNALLTAKLESKLAPIHVQNCIIKQSLELSKIHVNPLIACHATHNLTHLTELRNRILKLHSTAVGLISHCRFLNPMKNEVNHLTLCVGKKVTEITVQLNLLQLEFERNLREIINFSVNCILSETSVVQANIGQVLGATKNCRFIGPYTSVIQE